MAHAPFAAFKMNKGLLAAAAWADVAEARQAIFGVAHRGRISWKDTHPIPTCFHFPREKHISNGASSSFFGGTRRQQPVQKCVMEYPIRIRKGGRYGALSNPRVGIYLATVGRSRRFAKPSVPLRAFYRTVPEFFSP